MRVRVRHAARFVRHRSRDLLGWVLSHVTRTAPMSTQLGTEAIRSILICRINGRMGNTLFLTPLIRRLHELLPQASIDIAIAYSRSDELLGRLPGVRNVI